MPDAVATVDVVTARFGRPARTIAWGTSMGGQVAAGLVQNHPHRFDGALPLCASVAGPLGMLNAGLDAAFAVRTLLAPDSDLPLVDITDEAARTARARTILDAAQATPEGRARIALAAAFAQLSTWSVTGTPRLARAPRISADPSAVDYMRRNVTPTGRLDDPVLTLHETGDNAPTVTQARAYTAAEILTTMQVLGRWPDTDARSLNDLAARLDAASPLDLGTAGFARYRPDPFLRPYHHATP